MTESKKEMKPKQNQEVEEKEKHILNKEKN